MKVAKGKLPGVLLIEPAVYRDHRGFFLESYNRERYAAMRIGHTFIQEAARIASGAYRRSGIVGADHNG